MARTENEKDRDSKIINVLDMILHELIKIDKKLEGLDNAKK